MAASGLARSVFVCGVAAACALFAALMLGGCGGGHPIVRTDDCASCHSDGRAAAGAVPDSAVQTGLSFSVESSADEVYLCYVAVADTDDSTVIPVNMRTLSADELAEVSVPEPGLYAVCTGPLDGPSSIAVIEAGEGGPEGMAVKL